MDKKNILIYDKKQAFQRYFKKGFPNCNFVVFSGNQGEEFKLDDYDFILFVVESEINLNEFFKMLNSRVKLLFFSSLKNEPNGIEELKNWFDIKFINIDCTKREIKQQLGFHLKQHSKNKMGTSFYSQNLKVTLEA